MKKLIKDVEAATYKKYNANTRGTNTGDCVKRSLSMAFDISYNEVGKELNAIMKETRFKEWNVAPVFEKFITDHGGSGRIAPPEKGLLLDDWVDEYATTGTYVVETGSKPCGVGGGNHLVCV